MQLKVGGSMATPRSGGRYGKVAHSATAGQPLVASAKKQRLSAKSGRGGGQLRFLAGNSPAEIHSIPCSVRYVAGYLDER